MEVKVDGRTGGGGRGHRGYRGRIWKSRKAGQGGGGTLDRSRVKKKDKGRRGG